MDERNKKGGSSGATWPLARAPEDLVRPENLPRTSLLVLAPHPDDEVLATGGLIHALARRGDAVRVLVLTDGSRGGFRSERDDAYVELRERETRAGLERLGVRDVAFFGYPDGGLAGASDLPERIAREIDAFRPTAATVPGPFEIHPDHLAAGAGLAAALRLTAHRPRLLLSEIGAPVLANWILDVTDLMEVKKAAIACHASQLADNDFLDKTLGLNRYRTVNCGERTVRYAEAYLEIHPDDLSGLLEAVHRLVATAERRRPSASWRPPSAEKGQE